MIPSIYIRSKIRNLVRDEFASSTITVIADGGGELVTRPTTVIQESPFSVAATLELGADEFVGAVIESSILRNSSGIDLFTKTLAVPKAKGEDPVEISLNLEF